MKRNSSYNSTLPNSKFDWEHPMNETGANLKRLSEDEIALMQQYRPVIIQKPADEDGWTNSEEDRKTEEKAEPNSQEGPNGDEPVTLTRRDFLNLQHFIEKTNEWRKGAQSKLVWLETTAKNASDRAYNAEGFLSSLKGETENQLEALKLSQTQMNEHLSLNFNEIKTCQDNYSSLVSDVKAKVSVDLQAFHQELNSRFASLETQLDQRWDALAQTSLAEAANAFKQTLRQEMTAIEETNKKLSERLTNSEIKLDTLSEDIEKGQESMATKLEIKSCQENHSRLIEEIRAKLALDLQALVQKVESNFSTMESRFDQRWTAFRDSVKVQSSTQPDHSNLSEFETQKDLHANTTEHLIRLEDKVKHLTEDR